MVCRRSSRCTVYCHRFQMKRCMPFAPQRNAIRASLGKSGHTMLSTGYKGEVAAADDFRMLPGRGVSAVVNGKTILAGNAKMMTEQKIVWAEETAAQADNF